MVLNIVCVLDLSYYIGSVSQVIGVVEFAALFLSGSNPNSWVFECYRHE